MLKALGVCWNNPFRVQTVMANLTQGCRRRSNPGLTLANAFGVSTWLKLANAAGAPTLG